MFLTILKYIRLFFINNKFVYLISTEQEQKVDLT